MRTLLARRRRDESGAVAILVALLTLLILMFAAYAIDIGMQVNKKHQLNDTLDAAAQAGAYALPGSSVTARSDALAFAVAHDPTETGSLAPNVDFWCVVGSTESGGSYVVDTTQIPSTCNPGTGPYIVGANYQATGRMTRCSPVLCAIPCVEPTPNNATRPIACNTIRVFQGRDVPFAFAPAGGIMKGSTGNLISVACKGSCGTIAPNPLDVAVIADRTLSMRARDVSDMVDGIRGMLEQMTPSQQFVSLGAIGRSQPVVTSQGGNCNSASKGLTYPSDSGSSGAWLPVAFTDDYQTGAGTLKEGSTLVKGVECLKEQSDPSQGTSLASPMKAAARYLLGYDANNLGSFPPRETPAQKMIIFETDGQPNETQPTSGSTSLNSSADIFSNRNSTIGPVTVDPAKPDETTTTGSGVNTKTYITHFVTETYNYVGGANACNNLISVANNAKAQNILVIMIGYNLAGKQCNDYDPSSRSDTDTVTTSTANNGKTIYQTETTTRYIKSSSSSSVLTVMAQAASAVDGVQSVAESDCSNTTQRTAENSDGDYLFCGATGTDMAPIFRTALSQASKGIKFIKMP